MGPAAQTRTAAFVDQPLSAVGALPRRSCSRPQGLRFILEHGPFRGRRAKRFQLKNRVWSSIHVLLRCEEGLVCRFRYFELVIAVPGEANKSFQMRPAFNLPVGTVGATSPDHFERIRLLDRTCAAKTCKIAFRLRVLNAPRTDWYEDFSRVWQRLIDLRPAPSDSNLIGYCFITHAAFRALVEKSPLLEFCCAGDSPPGVVRSPIFSAAILRGNIYTPAWSCRPLRGIAHIPVLTNPPSHSATKVRSADPQSQTERETNIRSSQSRK